MSSDRRIPTFFWEYRNRPPVDIDLSTYRLTVGGAVDAPFKASLDELAERFEAVEVDRRFYCVNGWSLRALWRGFRIADVLASAVPAAGYDYLHATSIGGYDDITPIERLVSGDAMLVTHMDDDPLPVDRGKPMRMMLFDMYNFKGVKAVASIEVVADYKPGFWETVGYTPEMAEIQSYPHLAIDRNEEMMPEMGALDGEAPVVKPPRPRRAKKEGLTKEGPKKEGRGE